MPFYEEKDFSIYKHRRERLLNTVKGRHLAIKTGGILLVGIFEDEKIRFRQDSTFYYFTGIEEPGAALWIDLSGQTTLYIPDYKGGRSRWVASTAELEQGEAEFFGFDEIEFLGKPCSSYKCFNFFVESEYEYLIQKLVDIVSDDGTIFTCNSASRHDYIKQKEFLKYLNQSVHHVGPFPADLLGATEDISAIIAHMRRKKDQHEIELLYRAISITALAHGAAAQIIKPDRIEYQVQAAIEFIFTDEGGSVAFPSIVASGVNSTILHYTLNNRAIEKGDLVVVDIGAEYNYYCADLTRTYPANKKFSKRQKEIYSLVLEVQEYIAQIAKPGMWIINNDHKEQSLHHLAKAYFDRNGEYADYFLHNIGHFLGLDVHDVGNHVEPLCEGDVFTIEPGLYLSDEKIGIRIEDNYWMTEKGAVCLSEELPKSPEQIEKMMQKEIE